MKEIREIINAYNKAKKNEKRLALATLVHLNGSSYRRPGARMIVDDAITDGEKIAETLARLGIVSTGPPKRRQSTGELDYVYEV